MTKIAILEVVLPDDTKLDDVFNKIRSGQHPTRLLELKPNPNDPPFTKVTAIARIEYEARGAQDASDMKDEIHIALVSVKGVTGVKITDDMS